MTEQRQQPNDGGRRWKTILFWLIVIVIPVLAFVAWRFAIGRFLFALVIIVPCGRLIEREFAKLRKRTPLVVVQAVTYAFVVAMWSLIAAAESTPRFGQPLDLVAPARMFLVPALCWYAYEFFRLRRMLPVASHQ